MSGFVAYDLSGLRWSLMEVLMQRTEMLQEIQKMRFEEVIVNHFRSKWCGLS
jgi:hypothetical protein